MFSKTALPDVSRVMCRPSRIGTPLATRVPRVRVVRATMFFSTSWPKIGISRRNRRQRERGDRVAQGAFALPFQRLGPFLELGQSLENDLQGAAGLARLDHVDVEP